MKPQKQAFRHDPENGVYGDCYRTAIACMLDMERDEVPHFYEGDPPVDVFNKRAADFLATRGLTTFLVAFDDFESMLNTMQVCNPNINYIVSGTSPRGTCHAVIGHGDKIIHDPHPDGGDLVAPCSDGLYWIEIFTPLAHHT